MTDQRSGRKRFDIHKNIESSKLYPDFTIRYLNNDEKLNSRSSIFTQSSRLNIIGGPMSHILSQPDLTQNKSSKTYPTPSDIKPKSPEPKTTNPMPQLTPLPQINDILKPTIQKSKFASTESEIEKLKAELEAKEEEIKNYQSVLQSTKNSIQDQELMNCITKLEFDKKQIEERRKMNSMNLDYQINEKNELKNREKERKEKELLKRLEMLKVMKEQENKEIIEKAYRAKEYKEQLDIQKYVRESMNLYRGKMINSPGSEQKSELFQHRPPNPFKNSESSGHFSPLIPKFTKKTQRTISHDPITGKVQDSSPYIFGQHPLITRRIHNPKSNSQSIPNESVAKSQNTLANYGSMVL